MRFLRHVWVLAAAAVLSACGGGGGSAGTVVTGTGQGSNPSGSSAAGSMAITIVDASGAQVTNISVGNAYSARATVRDAGGNPQSGRLVTFTLSGASLATLTPDTALTNGSGVAEVGIAPASLTAIGAATLTGTTVLGTATITATRDFGVSAANLSLSAITVGSTTLPSGGNTSVSVTALLGGAASTGTPVNVTFSASCGRINNAGSSFSVTTSGSGVASASYTAVNSDGSLCSGPVTLTASSPGTSPRTAALTVATPAANAIAFVSATPQQIFVAGSGALEQSVLRFRVTSGTTPMANEPVVFSLLVNPGGVGLGSAGSTANVTATTDSAGEARVSVFSGTIPGPVRVRAALASNATVFSESQNLTVASGPASQRFMSVSVQNFNIEGANRDGVTTRITARLADRQGNPVEDGTVVNFTAEGGQVASSCSTVRTNGIASCSVDFISQNPRPAGGRVSVLAFTNGTKDYVDVNNNNRYDAGIDTLVDIGDAFRDDNENDTFDLGEFVIPRGGALACAGVGNSFPARINTCDNQLATTVRQQVVIMFSSSTATLDEFAVSTGSYSFRLRSADNRLLPMPAGSTVAVEAADQTPGGATCSLARTSATTVANFDAGNDPETDVAAGQTFTAFLTDCAPTDQVIVRVTTPAGLQTVFTRDLDPATPAP